MRFAPTTAVLAAAILAVPASADPLQTQLAAAARATPREVFAFRRTLMIERTGAAKKVVVEQYDPRRAPADRWTLVSIDGRAPTAKELAEARKAKRGKSPSYAELADWIAAPAARVDGPPGYVSYRYARLPAGAIKLNDRDLSPTTRAEALVNTKGRTPFVERVRLTVTKGFRVMLVASVDAMTVTQNYRPLADGTPFPADMMSDVKGSMLGKSGAIHTGATYSAIQKVR